MLILDFFNEFWYLINSMSIYLLFGFLMAGVMSVYISNEFVYNNLGNKKGLSSIIKSSLLGIPLPLCSCSVIPVAASLKNHGASKPAVTSFLLSTPQTGVDSILVTYGLLGPLVAVVRPIIALFSGFIGGVVINTFDKEYPESTIKCEEECCASNNDSIIKKIMRYAFITLPKDIARPLISGLIIASLISMLIPSDFLTTYVGDGFTSMLLMIMIGTPLYICATASIPLAVVFMSKGATLGAALVFLMVGPATNTTSIVTMIKILGKKSTILVIGTLILFSICIGMLVDSLSINISTLTKITEHSHDFSIYHHIISIFLLFVIINSMRSPIISREPSALKSNAIIITGMTCNNCVSKISHEIKSLGYKDFKINLDDGTLTINDEHIHWDEIKNKIKSIGFDTKS